MKPTDQQLLEEAYGAVHKQSQPESAEQLLDLLVQTIAEREQAAPGGYEYDTLETEVDEIWSKLNDMGYSTKQLNHYCQKAGVL